jgi:hypothetical protein
MRKAIGSLLALCAAVAAMGVLATPALGAASDPLFILHPEKPADPKAPKEPPPAGYFEGPCGLAVASNGYFSVSDYYHHTINTFKPDPKYVGQITKVDALDGPCGLAFNSTDTLYVNNFHRNVTNLSAGSILPLPSEDTLHHLPTGVAIEPVTNNVFVDHRTYISVFDSTGAPVMDGPEPLRIGVGTIGNGYGVGVSKTGRVYVPDASTKTLKVYEPSVDKVSPVATIFGPGKGFSSLVDAAVAIDQSNGVVYVIDNLQPIYTEEPEAAVYVFSPSNTFLGVLKYKIYDALPPGIAVDNSGGPTQGRVYVTSGNTDDAGVYAYGPGAQTGSFLPPSVGLTVGFRGSGDGMVSSDVGGGTDCSSTCSLHPLAGGAVTLTAVPDAGSEFTGWSGEACTGTDESCTVTMSETRSVSAEFQALSIAPASPSSVGPPPASATPLASSRKPVYQRRHRHRARKHRHHRVGHRH